ncbi:MAG: glycoside hydrolase family 15 protein [Bacteroidota bacterium]|nr:glycoside hydrolase family 15 protein [Bacteroidota bacterium]
MEKSVHKYPMGIIGNCSYLAYIDLHANVKWLCMPRFDSSFLFGSLLDSEKGGDFKISPPDNSYQSKQYYLQNTNILCTEFKCSDGSFKVTDFAPRFYQQDRFFRPLMLLRKIEPLEGRPMVKVICKPVGDYGQIKPEILAGSNHLRFLNIGSHVRLTTDISLNNIVDEKAFVLSEARYLIFSYELPLESGLIDTFETFFKKTRDYWQNWVKTTSIPSIYQKEMIRSALVLKIHQYEDTGGIIASGSMGLPEFDGSGRNWDYRYCWMRDTYYTLYALNSIGHFEESQKYFQYIENIIASEKSYIQPIYSITGQKEITEKIINLKGYMDRNVPVRTGNLAYTHIQNDVYGQVLVSLLPLYTDKRLTINPKSKSLDIIHFLLDKIEETMFEPDAGLWEFRNKKQLHCYTFLFHWAGSRAALKIGIELNDPNLIKKGHNLIEKAAQQIEKCYCSEKQAYTQAIGNDSIDASCLKLISMGYLECDSERARKHIEAIERELKTDEGYMFRYKHDDGFGIPETTFMMCAFWYSEALACVGRVNEASKVLDNLIKTSNHLDLLSEDVGLDGSQWGNFPQTYSHVGLMNAVFGIARKLNKPLYD